jgi:hypothetical protein
MSAVAISRECGNWRALTAARRTHSTRLATELRAPAGVIARPRGFLKTTSQQLDMRRTTGLIMLLRKVAYTRGPGEGGAHGHCDVMAKVIPVG